MISDYFTASKYNQPLGRAPFIVTACGTPLRGEPHDQPERAIEPNMDNEAHKIA